MIEIRATSDPALMRTAHRRLLVGSFRDGELMGEDDFVAQFAAGVTAFLAVDHEERMLGLAVCEPVGAALLLQYLVASPAVRGRGVGTALLRAVIDGARDRDGVAVLLAEFDRPDVQVSHPLHGDPERRLGFYGRYGALALELPYFQPPIAEGAPREHGMLLAVFDGDGTVSGRGRLTPAQSDAVLGYIEASLDGAADPDAQRLREAADDSLGIRVRPLADYRGVPRSPLDASA